MKIKKMSIRCIKRIRKMYGIYFTHETGVFIIFHECESRVNILKKNTVSQVK